mmetsp:Transcript_32777/g.75623  ORF Transcript_32777/g.75623 Transcript_32777/m.75623 type:complete len:385 (+) Transcript_32777:272-1426(+)
MLVGTIINTPDPSLVPPEVLGLLVNLMVHVDNARACAKARGALRGLVTLSVREQSTLALKLLRNMATHTGEDLCEELVRTFAADLLELVASAESVEAQLEALGLLADLPLSLLEELPELLVQSGALELASQLLLPEVAGEDDLLLEAVRFVAAAAQHRGCAPLLVGEALPRLVQLLGSGSGGRQEDDEIVLAAVHALHHLLFCEEAREWLLTESSLTSNLLDLLHDKVPSIRLLASSALDIIAEHDLTGQWVAQIRSRKFLAHNAEWLEAMEEDDEERYEEALAITQALGKMAVHDVSELEEMQQADVRARVGYDDGYDEGYVEDSYGQEYGLDLHSPGQLAGAGEAFGALSDEAYLGMGGESDEEEEGEGEGEYDEEEEVEED